jgi:hypothetical protein
LASGKIASTETTYKYHMQIQEDNTLDIGAAAARLDGSHKNALKQGHGEPNGNSVPVPIPTAGGQELTSNGTSEMSDQPPTTEPQSNKSPDAPATEPQQVDVK